VSVPTEREERHRLKDGSEIVVRPIRPDDEPLIVELHEAHSEHTIRMRFFGMVRHLSRESLTRLVRLDPDRELALAALHAGADGRPHIIGVSRYHMHQGTDDAEFAVVVTDAWQGKGVGSYLMRRLSDCARQRGVNCLHGEVLRENESMLRLMHTLGFAIQPTEDPGVVRAVLDLATPVARED
jgi:acetyltransferase